MPQADDRSPLTRTAATLVVGLFAGLVLVGGVATRLPALTGVPRIEAWIHGYTVLVAVVSGLWLLRERPKTLLVLMALAGAVLAHSYAHIYWPSLRIGVPRQDYLLADKVSSNYSFDGAKLYIWHVTLAILAGLGAGTAFGAARGWARAAVAGVAGLVVLANVSVAFVQSHMDLNWLAAGSGTAVGAGRAAALLEDSGASTVFCGAAVSALFFVTTFGPWSLKGRAAWLVAFALAAVAGAGTGGRIYFTAAAAGVAFGALLVLAQSAHAAGRRRAKGLLPVVLGVCVVAGFALPHTPLARVWTSLAGAAGQGTTFFDHLIALLTSLDEIRASHMMTMAKAFVEHPWAGTGLGTFYANYYEHIAWASQLGGREFADPPASFYLMILSELGLVGVVLIGMLAAVTLAGARLLLFGHEQPRVPCAWLCVAVGALVSLGVSFLIGLHIIFLSSAVLLSVIVFGLAAQPNLRRTFRTLRPVTAACSLVLLGAVAVLAATAPRSPAFRWRERGKPQVPLSLVVPIGTHGNKGIWLPSGSEILFDGKPVDVFAEMPPEYYPLTVSLTLIDANEAAVSTQSETVAAYDRGQPWRILRFTFPEQLAAACTKPSPERFCSVRLATQPVWVWDRQRVGAYVLGLSAP